MKMILKRSIKQKQLENAGFVITTTPNGIFAVRASNPLKPEEAVVIQLKGGKRELKWRYQSNVEKPIINEVKDIIDFFEKVYDVEMKYRTPIVPFFTPATNINELAKAIHENAVAHGWWEEQRSLGDIIALIHTELSEAFEEFRNKKGYLYYEDGKPEGIAVELIDAVIRIFDFLYHQGIDIDKILLEKHEFNKTRPYKHGGKVV
jgi:hypothetical protein